MIEVFDKAGAKTEHILLRNHRIEFCTNCRACTQLPGDTPGKCMLQDGMEEIIDKIEWADGYVLASPTNFGSATAIFKRFMERLVVYAFWSWNMNGPRYRKAKMPRKKAVLLSSCAAPGFLGRWVYCTRKELKMTATTIGADSVGMLFTGLIGKKPQPVLSGRMRTKIRKLAAKMV
jgi:putative NADPH-quinone reductase